MIKTAYDNYKYRALTGESTDWKGYWLTSMKFYHLPYSQQYGYNRIPEFNSEIQNVHTLFRKNFTLKDTPVKEAKFFITGDDVYKLYINSEFVGEGPAQSYPFAYNYNCYDVTDLLKSGENSVGVHIYYQGLFNIYLLSGDNLCGLIAQLEITYEDGSTQTVVSDRSWKYWEPKAFYPRHSYGYQTQLSEDIDLNHWAPDWHSLDMNIDRWQNALIAAKPYPIHYNLLPQITPPVKHEKVYPALIKKLDNGYFFDFGKEITGTLGAFVKGKKGDVIEIRFGEELNDDGSVRFDIRANCCYRDFITLCGEERLVEYFDYKGFRYAEILNVPADFDPKTVYTFNRHYPFPEKPAAFKSSSKFLNDLWEICVHGVKIGTQDTYYDCPTREKGGFLGDALITGLSHLIITGDTRIYKKFIMDCANTSRYCPAVMCHVPTYDINICSDYSLLVPLFLEEYYNYTGDMEFLKQVLPITEGVLEYYLRFKNADELLENIKHMPKVPEAMEMILIDWPPNLRDGYDFEKAKTGVSTVINMFLYGFVKTVAGLYNIIGDTQRADELSALYTAIGQSLIEKTYDKTSHVFFDTTDSTHSALHSNVLQLFFGLTPPDGFDAMVDLIMQRRLNCGVYFAYFVIKGLYNIGREDAAYDLLSGTDEHTWYNMLKEGATTCMEAWGKDQKWNTSWCHPWSSSPIYFIKGEILGIKIASPGMKTVRVAPKIPADLDFMELDFPVPGGRICASFKRSGNAVDYTISAPDNMELVFEGENINFKRI